MSDLEALSLKHLYEPDHKSPDVNLARSAFVEASGQLRTALILSIEDPDNALQASLNAMEYLQEGVNALLRYEMQQRPPQGTA